jgi:leucyl aminopeptidase
LKLHLISQQDAIPGSATIIIPVQPEELNSLDHLHQIYQFTGHQKLMELIKKGKGKHAIVFQGETTDARTYILFNASATSQNGMNQMCIEVLKSYSDQILGQIGIDLRFTNSHSNMEIDTAILRAIFLSDHSVGKYKTTDVISAKVVDELFVISQDQSGMEEKFQRALAASATIKSCMTLVNEPSNYKSPQDIADWMVNSGKEHGFEVEVLDKKMLEAQGFHALLSVNRGSEKPARCIIARYHGNKSQDAPIIGLVGKGVTFDTGGMSIKPSNNMHYMKSDMGGAAAVMGAIELVAKLKLPVNVFGILPCTDNSVDSLATKPGDVINSYKGSTIEVIDTDAEGRLILADGLNYAVRNLKPDYLVDLATLTGSVVRSLGSHAAGLMTNSEFMADSLTQAGHESGERVWRLPLWEDYFQYMCSDIADIKNLSDKPMAGAITAGKFLEHFTDEHPNWAHLDIAGTAFGSSPFSKGYSASGFGILLLLSWIEIINQNHPS